MKRNTFKIVLVAGFLSVLVGAMGLIGNAVISSDQGPKVIHDRDEPSSKPLEPLELIQVPAEAVVFVDCTKKPDRRGHELCRDDRLKKYRKSHLFLEVRLAEIPTYKVEAFSIWRNECIDTARVKTGVLQRRKQKLVKVHECQERFLMLPGAPEAPGTVVYEKAPDLHERMLARGVAVLEVWRDQGSFQGWEFTGWTVYAHPVGAREPELMETRSTAFDRAVTPLR